MAYSLKDDEAEKLNDSLVNISDSDILNQIIRKAELLLGNIGVKVSPEDIIFEIVTKEKIKLLQPRMENVVGLTWPIRVEGKKHRICLLENQAYIYLLSVVAHEMGHTWCRDNNVRFSHMEEEGFCELLAYHVLSTQFSKLGNDLMNRMFHNPDPIYGAGLRLMLKKFDNSKKSWFKFLAFMRLCH